MTDPRAAYEGDKTAGLWGSACVRADEVIAELEAKLSSRDDAMNSWIAEARMGLSQLPTDLPGRKGGMEIVDSIERVYDSARMARWRMSLTLRQWEQRVRKCYRCHRVPLLYSRACVGCFLRDVREGRE